MRPNKFEIFRRGSTTYFYSSVFFPNVVREDVFTLYAFVRTADDFVDQIPQDRLGFLDFQEKTIAALGGKSSGVGVIDDLVTLATKRGFDKKWVTDFLVSMESDITVKSYGTFPDLEKYIYGSAEVIGLMMASIMNLPRESYNAARLLGKSMQLINFIRDIQEDMGLGRIYIPKDDLQKFGVNEKVEVGGNLQMLVRFQIDRYRDIVKEAERGFSFIPKRMRVPIMTANDMYKWTADKIYKDPNIIFSRKVKPSPLFVVFSAIKNFVIANLPTKFFG